MGDAPMSDGKLKPDRGNSNTTQSEEGVAEGGDRQREIDHLRQQAEDLSGGGLIFEALNKLPPEIEAEFLRQIIAFETAEPIDLFELLIQSGISLPAPVLVSEEHILDILWEAIYQLSSLGCYLENTDHLSDRELYTLLWEQLLREPAILFPDEPRYAYHLDIIGSGSPEDQQTYLRYYANEEDRHRLAKDCPELLLPVSASRPYDRDRHLPRPFTLQTTPLM